MRSNFRAGLVTGVACAAILAMPHTSRAEDETLPELAVEATAASAADVYEYGYNTSYILPGEDITTPIGDGGDFLRSLPGVSGSRMGGHGIEPVIHGQQQTQLNILNDGAFIHGGCPNRMDPQSSFMAVDTFDAVTVLKGYQSVQYGPGGTGGTVLFERLPEDFTGDEFQTRLNAGAGFAGNGDHRNAYADAVAGDGKAQIRFIATADTATNYTDGGGNTVRSAYDQYSFAVLPTFTPTTATTITAGIEATQTYDALFAGAGMDSPEDYGLTYRIGMDHEFDGGGILQSMSFHAYSSLVDHVMDNYSLRTNPGMKMLADTSSDTFGATLSGDVVIKDAPVTIGLDHQSNLRDAYRFSGMPAATVASTPQSRLWPDVTISQTGLFAETLRPVAQDTRLKLGGRYDYVRASADAANEVFGAISANQLYINHYGRGADDATEHNLGGLIRLEHDLSPEIGIFAGLSRSMRTADATERYMAANSGMAAMRWVGNPYLDPEAHHQIDAGVAVMREKWAMEFTAYYDDVQDFILRDRARGQAGVVAVAGETVYRNVDATLAGFEWSGDWQVSAEWALDAGLAYTWGHNDTDHDALAQIPPLEGHVAASWARDAWGFGGQVNFATRQGRIDNGTSLRDVRETPGWATLDAWGSYDFKKAVLRFGVTNIFDNDYANHLNRSNSVDPTEVQVNEPGRTFYAQLNASF